MIQLQCSNAPRRPIKTRLREQTERAQALGLFGAPSFIVGDELFWGHESHRAGARLGAAARVGEHARNRGERNHRPAPGSSVATALAAPAPRPSSDNCAARHSGHFGNSAMSSPEPSAMPLAPPRMSLTRHT